MSSYQSSIRNGIYTAINAAMSGYVHTDISLEKTYYPTSNLEEISDKPEIKVTCLGMGSERDRQYRNAAIRKLSLGVMVHVQQRVNPADTAAIDLLIELLEQVMNTCEDNELVSGSNYNWELTEPLKDENDIIYSYEALTNSGVFQAVFIAHYSYILE